LFKGEAVIYKDFPAPIQDLVDRGVIEEKPYEKATMDLYNYPVWKDDKLHLIVCVFVVRNLYMGRPDVVRAKEYMDTHWLEEYDAKAVAKSVGMSTSQLFGLFKQHTGISPGE
jgi:AraC-like DNA-binding protein